MFRFLFIILIIQFYLIPNICLSKTVNPEVLKVALLPDENAAKIIQKNEKLKKYLEIKLGRKIDLLVTSDYSSMVEAIRFRRIHLGYFGPLSYVIAKSKTNITPFVVREKNNKSTYNSIIIGNREMKITNIKDIKDKTFGFGDVASTSSHLIPKKILLDKGLVEKKHYQSVFLGTHDSVAVSVQNGNISAGGISLPIYKMLVKDAIIDENKINIITVSDDYPQYPWVYIDELDNELKEMIEEAFITLGDSEILNEMSCTGFRKINDKDYDIIRELSKKLSIYDF